MFDLSLKFKKITLLIFFGGYLVLGFLFLQLPDHKFHIYFMDIGQGDAVLIKTPQNHQILIDGGPKNHVIEELGAVLPFFDKSLDLVVLTHPHEDHMGGLVEVLKRFDVENVLFTGAAYGSDTYSEFLKEMESQNIPTHFAEAGTDFLFGEVFVDVIYPFHSVAGDIFENVNNSSVGLRISYDEKVILLTGDLEIEAESELISSGVELEADIFKAGHHGSRTSSTLNFLQIIKPEVVVIQSGKDNSYGHPHVETLRNLNRLGVKEIYRNDLDGRVEFVF